MTIIDRAAEVVPERRFDLPLVKEPRRGTVQHEAGIDRDRAPSPSPHRWRSALWIGTAAVLGLVAGFLLQYAQLDRARRQVADATSALQAARLESTLSAAMIEAQRGRFEVARQHASDFYTGLQRRLLPVLDGASQGDVRTMLTERDSIITSLARNDPASAGTLTGVLVRLRETVHRAALDSSNVPGAP